MEGSGRRGFLRGLVSLPLIGGGVTLIGQPTAAATPVTTKLLNSYETWLDAEHSRLRWERYGGLRREDVSPASLEFEVIFRNRRTGDLFNFHRLDNPAAHFEFDDPPPSTRAAVILSAAGVPLA